jgi:glucose-fructose oxidoreductase
VKKVRYAVVGLGGISRTAVLPAFANSTRNSTLAALVSGDPKKLARFGKQYGVALRSSYDGYDRLLESGAVDAVYIALPNTLHRDFTERAAARGIHVLCEKPLARSAADCRAMIEACRRGGVKLMTAYRLHYEPATLAAIKATRSLGEPRFIESTFAFTVKTPNIRLDERGGGPLFDIGIYCINAARHFFKAEPIEVVAATVQGSQARFKDVEQSASCVLRFSGDRQAVFTCSFDSAPQMTLRVTGTKGRLELDPPYAINAAKTLVTTKAGRKSSQRFPKTDQFAAELMHFSDCILRNRTPVSSGEEGLKDLLVIEALFWSARTRQAQQVGS